MGNKIIPFATANDTDRWIVSVDGYIQSFASRAEAESIYQNHEPAWARLANRRKMDALWGS